MKILDKKSITSAIYDELIKKNYGNILIKSKDYYQKIWWMTPNYSNTLRLSESGLQVFELLEIEKHIFLFRFNLENRNSNQLSFLKFLSNVIKCPYYVVENNQVIIFDNKIALKISLYGTILDYYNVYLKTYKVNKK